MQVRARIEELSDALTSAERKICAALLADYPYAGLEPIQTLAEHTQVSSPSISRFVSKLGFQGYQDFQRALIAELRKGQLSPLELHHSGRQVHGEYLEDFAARAAELLSALPQTIATAQFDRLCKLLSDDKRAVYVLGGRISDSIALYLSRHLRQVRAQVFHLPADHETWPEYLLRMRPRDVLFLVDFRRYQANLAQLAALAAKKRNVQVAVLTDKWLSPAAKHASDVFAVPIDSGTMWDSYTPALALMEAVVTKIAEDNWPKARRRIEAWDAVRLNQGSNNDDY